MTGELIMPDKDEQQWQCWICEKDKTGAIDLEVDDLSTNEHYNVCVGCFEKMAAFCTMFVKLHFENTRQDLKAGNSEFINK